MATLATFHVIFIAKPGFSKVLLIELIKSRIFSLPSLWRLAKLKTSVDKAVPLDSRLVLQSSFPEPEGSIMDTVHDDRFMIFLRPDPSKAASTGEFFEQPLASCSSYAEASRIRQTLHETSAGGCVIRFVGQTGGGD